MSISSPTARGSNARSTHKSAKSAQCPITCSPISEKNKVIFSYTDGKQTREIAYDKTAIFTWLAKYTTCPATNKDVDSLVDKTGKTVWKKSSPKKPASLLTLPVLSEMYARVDRMDRVAPPALEALSKKLDKASKHQETYKSLGIQTQADVLALQEKIDRVASVVTTANFIRRLQAPDKTLKNLVTLLKGIKTTIGQQLKNPKFAGFAKHSLINKRAVISKIVEKLAKIKDVKGAALEKSYCQIASSITTPLELEQICSLAPEVLLITQKGAGSAKEKLKAPTRK